MAWAGSMGRKGARLSKKNAHKKMVQQAKKGGKKKGLASDGEETDALYEELLKEHANATSPHHPASLAPASPSSPNGKEEDEGLGGAAGCRVTLVLPMSSDDLNADKQETCKQCIAKASNTPHVEIEDIEALPESVRVKFWIPVADHAAARDMMQKVLLEKGKATHDALKKAGITKNAPAVLSAEMGQKRPGEEADEQEQEVNFSNM